MAKQLELFRRDANARLWSALPEPSREALLHLWARIASEALQNEKGQAHHGYSCEDEDHPQTP